MRGLHASSHQRSGVAKGGHELIRDQISVHGTDAGEQDRRDLHLLRGQLMLQWTASCVTPVVSHAFARAEHVWTLRGRWAAARVDCVLGRRTELLGVLQHARVKYK